MKILLFSVIFLTLSFRAQSQGYHKFYCYLKGDHVHSGYYCIKKELEDSIKHVLSKGDYIDSLSYKTYMAQKPKWATYNNKNDIRTYFYVSELYRDTFSVSKVLRYYEDKKGNRTGEDKVSLNRPLKLSIRDFNFFIPEGARIFESPNECSPVVNYRQEIDHHKNLKITDSFIDNCDDMWLRFSFSFDYDGEKDEEGRAEILTTYVDGWMLVHNLDFGCFGSGIE